MATNAEAAQAIVDRIAELAPRATKSAALLTMAEALAWVRDPNQPHGGSTTVSS